MSDAESLAVAVRKLAVACAAADIKRGDGEFTAGIKGLEFVAEIATLAAGTRTIEPKP